MRRAPTFYLSPLRERIENLSEFPFPEIRLDFLGEGVLSARTEAFVLVETTPSPSFSKHFCKNKNAKKNYPLPQGGEGIAIQCK